MGMEKNKERDEAEIWPDNIAKQLKGKQIIHGMWTPSGYFHIGNARVELFTPYAIYQALKDMGRQVKFNFLFDDFDDFDKIPSDFEEQKQKFEKFLGKPLRKVPSPGKGKSWADFFTQEAKKEIKKFRIKPNFISSYDAYHKGLYDKAIKIVLTKSQEIKVILEKYGIKKPKEWLPVMPVCEKCGKSATTIAAKYEGKFLYYSCSQDREYCKSCGWQGRLIPGKGNVKLPWRVHWPATWFVFGTTFESGGKDHFAAGGSVDSSKELARKIFGIEPPMLMGCEFIQFGSKKISSSTGNVITLANWLEVAEPELLKFMCIAYRPSTVIEFSFENLPLLVERYDKAEKFYFQKAKSKNEKKMARQYKISQIKKPKQITRISFNDAIMAAQIFDIKKKELFEKLAKAGFVKEKLNKDSEKKIVERIKLARAWLKYAPESLKIKLVQEPKIKVNEKEKKMIKELSEKLQEDISSEEIQNFIYEIARKNNVEPKVFFSSLYNILINKNYGPRLGAFIIALGKNKVVKILKKV